MMGGGGGGAGAARQLCMHATNTSSHHCMTCRYTVNPGFTHHT